MNLESWKVPNLEIIASQKYALIHPRQRPTSRTMRIERSSKMANRRIKTLSSKVGRAVGRVMRAMEAKANRHAAVCASNLRQVSSVEAEQIASPSLAVQHNREQVSRVLGLVRQARHKDRLAGRLLVLGPRLGLACLQVDLS
jgi:hypothetical protein